MTVLGQLAILFGICWIGEGIVALLPIQFPASVTSMILLLVLLMTGILKDHSLEKVSSFLMANMAFFFLPPFVETMEYLDLLRENALAFLVVVGLTTPVVYGAAAWTVQLWMMGRRRRERRKGSWSKL